MRTERSKSRLPARLIGSLVLALLVVSTSSAQRADGAIRIMLLTGQASVYHNWPTSSVLIERLLGDTGLFDVERVLTPAAGESMAGFSPRWSDFDAIVMDYDSDDIWPAETKQAFEDYLADGGGLVLVHAADNAFTGWSEFQRMIGVGGWRGRDASAGPMLRWRDGRQVLDTGPGTARHPAQHDFQVVTRAPEHPIMRGLPAVWMHANDELYSQLRGPAENVTILATARADPSMRGGTGEHEPMLMAIRYGDGRIFHTTLGHVSPRDDESVATMRSVGFIVTLERGTEWAATGAVTQAVPDDFPGADAPVLRD